MTDAPPGPEPGAADQISPGAWLAPGRQLVVDGRVVEGRWFAHRPTEAELATGRLAVVPDFAPVAAFSHRLPLADGREVRVVEPDATEPAARPGPQLVLRGPDGWLADAEPGGTVLLGVAGGQLLLRCEPPGPASATDGSAMAATFERLGAGQPVPLVDLVIHLLLDHAHLFDDTPAPIGDQLTASGLGVDGTSVHRANVRAAARHDDAVGVAGLGLESSVAAERLLGALLATDAAAPVGPDVVAALADPTAVSALAEQVVGGALVEPAQLGQLLDRIEPEAPERARPGLAFLRLRLAEWRADPAEHDAALAAAVHHGRVPAALVDAAWFASDRGDARDASALLRAAHVPADDPDAQLLARFTAAGPRSVGRNDPCWCGSGRKHKQCCLRLNGHDLASRAAWLHAKAVMFLQRPPQRPDLFAVAVAHAQVRSPDEAPARVIGSACDPSVAELCLAEGGAFDRFLDRRGHLLPDDERELAESWRGGRHRIWGVVDGGRALRAHDADDEHPLDGPSAARVERARLVLAVVRPGPLALPGAVVPVGEDAVTELAELLAAGDPAPIAALLGRKFGRPATGDLGSPVDPDPSALAAAP